MSLKRPSGEVESPERLSIGSRVLAVIAGKAQKMMAGPGVQTLNWAQYSDSSHQSPPTTPGINFIPADAAEVDHYQNLA